MELITRAEAKSRGLTRYFTGRKCPKGHITERRVCNCECAGCTDVRSRKRYQTNDEYRQRTLSRIKSNYAADPQKFRDRSNENYKADCFSFKAHSANSRAREWGRQGILSGEDIRAALAASEGICACGASLTDAWHVDHVIPLCREGLNKRENIRVICPPCNMKKGFKLEAM